MSRVFDASRALQIFERVIGSQWLKSELQKSSTHSIVVAWKAISEGMERHSRTGLIERVSTETFRMCLLAQDLERAWQFPHYFDSVHHGLLDLKTFDNFEYTVRIAAVCARAGHSVAFVPQQSRRSPDISLDAGLIHVECKRKDRVLEAKPDPLWPQLSVSLLDAKKAGSALRDSRDCASCSY